VATLGPASDTATTGQVMADTGVTGFRTNTSLLSLSQLDSWLERLVALLPTAPISRPMVLDLQGSQGRPGNFPARTMVKGKRVTLTRVPTRAEVCHLYDLLPTGYAGMVLSDQTAIGDAPPASCRAVAMYR
jgi:pyruvate kinase